jgi:IS5 family transposase
MTASTPKQTDLLASDSHRRKIDELGDPLMKIAGVIDFAALAAAVDKVAPRADQSKGGRPPYSTETMVRIVVLKRLYNLSDEAMEYQLLDRMSYQRFCGLSQLQRIPDRTTVWTFENRIGEVGAKALFAGMDQQLLAKGYLARCGQIVDATLVPAPKQHFTEEEKKTIESGERPADWSQAKASQKDTDARWVKKHGKSTYGYKLSVNVDVKHKLIRKTETSAANEHDSQHFDAVLDPDNTCAQVFADRGYASGEREAELKACGIRSQIQRKGARNKALSACQKRRNARIAKTRARVEHVFAGIAHMGGKLIRTIGQARANFAMTLMATCYNIKRVTYLQHAGVKGF